MRRRPSLTLRLTLLFGAAGTAVLLALGYVIGNAVDQHFADQDRADLKSKLDLAAHILARAHGPAELDLVPQRLDDALVGQHDLSIAIVRASGEILFATSGTHFPQPLLQGPPAARAGELRTWETDGHLYRGMVDRLPLGVTGEPPALVAVAINIDHHRAFMRDFQLTLWIAVAAGVLLTALLGFVAARGGLGPLRQMTAVARRVSATRLTDRVPLDRLPAELVELGASFNQMLERLEDSFRRLSDFSSDLAHELRTPVGTLMTETQVALARARSAEEYREILYSNLEELDRMARMIGDMLFLAKAENDLIVPRNEVVILEDETRQLFDFYDALAEEQGVRLELQGEGRIAGDPLMIRRALSNLLSNALRHTARGETVRVGIDRTDRDHVRLVVQNPGAIAPEHAQRVFDRFYRLDPARQRAGEGTGLGLAITKSIVEAHRGVIELSSRDGLTRFILTFPAAPQRATVEPPSAPGTSKRQESA